MTNRDGIEAFEREAARVYSAAGEDIEAGAAPLRLVNSLLGPDAIRWADGEWIRGGGALGKVHGEWRIYLSRRYPLNNLRFVALHELAHWLLPGASETECDALAACLLAPRPAFQRAVEETVLPRRTPARVYSDLGAWFGCTHAFAALRFGEVTGTPLALISPGSVRVRGDWSLPAEPTSVRDLAVSPKPGLKKARLRDDPTRLVVRTA